MNRIWLETPERDVIFGSTRLVKRISDERYRIWNFTESIERETYIAEYESEDHLNRAWAMLENAIASGVRLFRLPTDAELEADDE